MKPFQCLVLLLFSLLLLNSCAKISLPSATQSAPSTSPSPEKVLPPSNPKTLPVLHQISCQPTTSSTSDFKFADLISSEDGWQIMLNNVQEKEVAIQSLTIIFPTREVPETTAAKIKTAENEVECWRKVGGGRFEGCTSVVNYQIKGNEEFSLLFQNIDSAKEIPSWRVKIGYKRDEPPTQTKDIKGNQITYFPTYEFEMECG